MNEKDKGCFNLLSVHTGRVSLMSRIPACIHAPPCEGHAHTRTCKCAGSLALSTSQGRDHGGTTSHPLASHRDQTVRIYRDTDPGTCLIPTDSSVSTVCQLASAMPKGDPLVQLSREYLVTTQNASGHELTACHCMYMDTSDVHMASQRRQPRCTFSPRPWDP